MTTAAQTDLAAALTVTFHPLVRAESERPFAWRAEVTGANGWRLDAVLGLLAPAEADALACYCATLAIGQAVARGLTRTEALLIVPVPSVCATTGQAIFDIVAAAQHHGLPADRIVVEISADERVCPEAAERLAEACALDGLSVAFGSFASGPVSLNLLARFKPRFVLLARALARNIGGSDSRRSIVEGTLRLAGQLGTTVIAPAAESEDEREALCRLGISHRERGTTAPRALPSAVAPRRAPRTVPLGTQRDASLARRTVPVGSFAAFETLVSA
jgi:EAL domain-containing protein (putative c-di-GMP-specific phosphodiesterase class I)